ncbi:MAG: polysaccharide biosynthesis protein [Candidatus Omnitrophica bacterium]|nr:polysaccharide biosynthesis protein [Candidatus Omnitrophota bacterium]MBU1047356.1 polysaccharide biosynthesis protein [Candidatus Omnitrophota bacterium]MBU1630858.1 polysaccharide biosynthesis protein [Candidatus Omnitrophota bacterium]MBU1889059.1 polysaccharide biosynthesis protein [Candidatus Omnitrophota bacterium]
MKITFWNKILLNTVKNRVFLFIISDILLISFSVWLAFFLRFDGNIPQKYLLLMRNFILLTNLLTLPIFYYFRLYHFSWGFIGMSELSRLIKAITGDFILIGTILFFLRGQIFLGFPRSVFLISAFLIFLTCGGIRFSKRAVNEFFKKPSSGKKILIVGAGNAGEQLLRNILSEAKDFYNLIGFIDDDLTKQGIFIHGFRILGTTKNIPRIVKEFNIQRVIIAIPSATGDDIAQIYKFCHQSKVSVSIVPRVSELLDKRISISQIRKIQPEDILGRKTVKLDTFEINKYLEGKCVMITGAAGSIGSELSRQIAGYNIRELLLIDKEETALYELNNRIYKFMKEKGNSDRLSFYLNNIRNKECMERIFSEKKPDIIFHAAAYKHVSMLEKEVIEGVLNNIEATVLLAELAMKFKTKQFVYISTDKAVNPTSVMGTTKRMGELFIKSKNNQNITNFIAVRFGNVFASRGSVIPIFERQIKEGGPVTVTHPKCLRYFMTIPESVQLILKAGSLGKNGNLYILDMGNPLKLEEIARKLIEFYSNGETEEKINIEYIGLRPGEKLVEELHYKYENLKRVNDSKLFLVVDEIDDRESKKLVDEIEELIKQAHLYDQDRVIKKLKELVPEYKAPKMTDF